MPDSTTLTPKGAFPVQNGNLELTYYTMDGFECTKDVILRSSTHNLLNAFLVTTVREPTPHYITSMITDGYKWKIPYVGMQPLRLLNDEFVEDEILTMKVVDLDRGKLYDGFPIGSFINGYMVYPSHTQDGRIIDPITNKNLLAKFYSSELGKKATKKKVEIHERDIEREEEVGESEEPRRKKKSVQFKE